MWAKNLLPQVFMERRDLMRGLDCRETTLVPFEIFKVDKHILIISQKSMVWSGLVCSDRPLKPS